jgi:hypothetical protein
VKNIKNPKVLYTIFKGIGSLIGLFESKNEKTFND